MDKELFKNLIFNIIYHILAIFVPFITAPYLGQVLGVEQIGIYSFVASIATLFSCVAMLGIKNYGSREIAKIRDNKETRSRVFCEIITMQLITTGIAVTTYSLFAILFLKEYSIAKVFIISMIADMIDVSWFFFGMEKFKTIVKRNIIIKVANVSLIFLLIKEQTDLTKYAYIVAGGVFFSQMILLLLLPRDVHFVLPDLANVLPRFKPNFTLFLPILASSIYQYMDKIMIGSMASKSDLAYYDYAEKIIQIPLLLFGAAGTVMLSRMSNLGVTDKNQGNILLKVSMDISLVFAAIFAFGLAAVSDSFVTIYYGKDFQASGLILMLLTPAVVFYGWTNVLRMQYVIPNNLDKIYVTACFVGATVNLIFNALLIPRFASNGAAVGTILAYFSVAFVFTAYTKKNLPLWYYAKINIPYLLIGLFMFIFIKLIQPLHSSNLTGLLIDIVSGGLFYSVLVLLMVIPRYNKERLSTPTPPSIIEKHFVYIFLTNFFNHKSNKKS